MVVRVAGGHLTLMYDMRCLSEDGLDWAERRGWNLFGMY